MRGYSIGSGVLAGLDTFVPLKTGLSTTLRCRVATTLFGVRDKVSQGKWSLEFGFWYLEFAEGCRQCRKYFASANVSFN
jgi:hypothetical protein